MGEALAELFSSRMRAAVLGELLPRPHLAFSLTELSRRLGLPISSLQHECYKLVRLGVLRDERAGATRRYRSNPDWPLTLALTRLIAAAIGPEAGLRGAVEGIGRLDAAAVAGELRPGEEPVYLVLIGMLPVEAVDGAFARAAIALESVLRPGQLELAFFLPDDWARREATGNPFVFSLLRGAVLPLAGRALLAATERAATTGR